MTPPNPPTPPNPSDWTLDDLEINQNSVRSGRRSLTRQETFVLAWLIFNNTDRTYPDMARECNMYIEDCRRAVLGLIEEDLIQLR